MRLSYRAVLQTQSLPSPGTRVPTRLLTVPVPDPLHDTVTTRESTNVSIIRVPVYPPPFRFHLL